jgi:two-component system, response regulator
MPRMSGREAIAAIKGDASLRRTPLVVLTGSTAHEDIADSYDKGVASFITKPETFDGLVATVHSLRHYWFGVVQLPQ